MKRTSHILFSTLTVIALFLASLAAWGHEGHQSKEAATNPVLSDSIYNLSSKWTSQDGNVIYLSQLRGRPALLAMIYTSCEHACPLIVEDMKKIENGLPKTLRSSFSFYLFSFDTARDSPARLKHFAETRKLDLKRWTLFNGNQQAVRELAAVLGIRFKKDVTGDFDHSNVITLLDSDGLIRKQQQGLNQNPTELLEKVSQLKLESD